MSQKLNSIYRSILLFAGMEADQNGYISTVMDTNRDAAFIDGLRMVLPTSNQLHNFNPKESIVFHPLTENIIRGESEVITKLKSTINVRLNFAIGMIAQSLINLVASPALHHKLSPEQAELLTSITDADEKSLLNFVSCMMTNIKAAPDRVFTNIYLKRGGTYEGKRYSRVGIVTFPFYEKIKAESLEKIRVKDYETYRQLFEFMLPGLDNPEEYNYGSNSHVAPYLEALMRTAANVASRLNDLVALYSEYIEDSDRLVFDSDWMEDFQDLTALMPEIRKIPVQKGNEGRVASGEVQMETEAPAAAAPQVQAPVQYAAPAQQQMAPQAPEIKRTRHGLDFKSVMQANPNVAMAPNALVPPAMNTQYMAQMNEANRVPSWAAPQVPYQHQQAQYGAPPMGYPGVNQQMSPLVNFGFPPGSFIENTQYGPIVRMPNGQTAPVPPQLLMQQQAMPMGHPAMSTQPSWASGQPSGPYDQPAYRR